MEGSEVSQNKTGEQGIWQNMYKRKRVRAEEKQPRSTPSDASGASHQRQNASQLETKRQLADWERKEIKHASST
ncbi:hypothetical protein NDU88_005462 [Pleurodeles waltl]|uniref:Uncharacterized protein n=1 Tax=Pleurodeles waltl TaxID=8319 RepID=A0AAV7MAL4_PLEWA|nr:hypothetical protein NDU88_005462 [Pleurodeles waltl]